MKAVLIFLAIVLLGVFGAIFISNQGQKPNETLSTAPTPLPITPPATNASPTDIITQVTQQPEQKAKKAIIKTSKGDITLSLYPDDAPGTVGNFANKSQSGFYNDLTFHRVEDWVIQGGDPQGNGSGGGNMPTELNKKPFVVGSLGVARGGDIKVSNDAQFFITKTDSPHLNEQYTNFGIVTNGMDVVNKIEIGDKILGITVE